MTNRYLLGGTQTPTVAGTQAITEVSTIAELTALAAPTDAICVQPLGYYAAGDGGGGPPRYWSAASTATHNGGSVLQPSSAPAAGRWLWDFQPEVSIRWFGAKLDGVTNDYAAIAACVSAAESARFAVDLDAGAIIMNSGVTYNTPIPIRGRGRYATVITTTLSSGNLFEFNNASGSYDEGLVLEDFAVVGPASGSAVGIKIEGAVYPNSIIRNVLAKNFGSHGLYFDDCLTASLENVKAQGNGGSGIVVEQSNGIVLTHCSAESNTSKGYNFLNSGSAGERNGPCLVECHAEENGSDAVFFNQTQNARVIGGWYQVAGGVGSDLSAIYYDTCVGGSVIGAYMTTGGTTTNLRGVRLHDSQRVRVIGNNPADFVAGREVMETGTSPNNLLIANRATEDDIAIDSNGTFISKAKVDVIATASLPAAHADQDGRVVIEDAGAGDRNVIVYAGAQRFRIDGGAAF